MPKSTNHLSPQIHPPDQPWTKIEAERRTWSSYPLASEHKPRMSTSATQIHFIVSGSVAYHLNHEHQGTAHSGQLLWIPVGSVSQLHATSSRSRQLEMITLRLRSGVWSQQNTADREAIAALKRLDARASAQGPRTPLRPATKPVLQHELDVLCQLWSQPHASFYCSRLKAHVLTVLMALMADGRLQHSLSELSQLTDNQAMMRASRRIEPALFHLSRKTYIAQPDLRVSDLAKLCGYKSARFHDLFVQATGTTPQRFLTEQRIQLACELLRQPHNSILEVAYSAGYNTPSRFYQSFKNVTGMAPRQWIKQHTN